MIMRTINEMLLFLILSAYLARPAEGIIEDIVIGAIFHEGDDELEAAFDEALKELADENTFFNLVAMKKLNVVVESYQVATVVCDLLKEGVVAIFGPSNAQTRNVVANIAARFNIPHIEYSYRHKDDIVPYSKSINVYPNAKMLEEAIAEVARHMTWHGYIYLYQTNDALARSQKSLQNPGRDSLTITIRELEPLSRIKQLRTERERDSMYVKIVKGIYDSTQYSLLLDVEVNNLAKLLDTMNEMEIMTDYFMCLIATLDASTVDVPHFIKKGSVANITLFKFLKNDSKVMTVEAALLYDSVFAFNDAMTYLYKHVNLEDVSKMQAQKLACSGEARYQMGLNITETFINRTRYGRKTGLMTFNERGERNFEFDIMNIQAGHFNKVGHWKDGILYLNMNQEQLDVSIKEAMKKKVFRVVTRVGPPYIKEVDDVSSNLDKAKQIGNKFYEGYCLDLIDKIIGYMHTNVEYSIVPDGQYGNLDPVTKQWNGLIKQLIEHKADMAICDLTITSERQSAVDFTSPFMNLGISILFSSPEKVEPKLFAFMDPLSVEVWMCVATAYLIVTLMLFFQARVAPGEWVNPHPCNTEPEELENNFTLMNSFWLTMGSLMQQGCDILPRVPSIRMVAGMWWFFVLIIVSSYTANLAAFLTAVKMEDTVDNIEDLAKQSKIQYGAVKDASTYSFFKNSNQTIHQRIFNTMYDAKPSVFTGSNDEGVERVLKGKRKYAFFMESTSIDYQTARHCELRQIGALLDNKGYGIAVPPNSPYRTMISAAILHFQEQGELQQLKHRWWKEKGEDFCGNSDEPSNSNELGMSHVGGVFLVLMIGSGISAGIGIVEFLWNIRNVAVDEKITPWEAFVKEIKFVVNIYAMTKPVAPAKILSQTNSFDKPDSVDGSTVSSLHRLTTRKVNNTGQQSFERA